jgi:hypothetical protein
MLYKKKCPEICRLFRPLSAIEAVFDPREKKNFLKLTILMTMSYHINKKKAKKKGKKKKKNRKIGIFLEIFVMGVKSLPCLCFI